MQNLAHPSWMRQIAVRALTLWPLKAAGTMGFMGLFVGLMLAGIVFALLTVRPRLAARLGRRDASLGALSLG